ncbi:MAG: hypothetical protein HYY51_01195 [Candidatus Magasanikbacteria bacterium]|nr:hypothetical protein [Candidatus Magasanikbacteria bacterium]
MAALAVHAEVAEPTIDVTLAAEGDLTLLGAADVRSARAAVAAAVLLEVDVSVQLQSSRDGAVLAAAGADAVAAGRAGPALGCTDVLAVPVELSGALLDDHARVLVERLPVRGHGIRTGRADEAQREEAPDDQSGRGRNDAMHLSFLVTRTPSHVVPPNGVCLPARDGREIGRMQQHTIYMYDALSGQSLIFLFFNQEMIDEIQNHPLHPLLSKGGDRRCGVSPPLLRGRCKRLYKIH